MLANRRLASDFRKLRSLPQRHERTARPQLLADVLAGLTRYMYSAAKLKTLIASAALVVLMTCANTMAEAAGGHEFTLPLARKFPSGLTLHIDGQGIDANGYRPFKVTVSTVPANKPLTADRQLRVVLGFYRNGVGRQARVSQVIELPEGSSTVTATMLVPQMGGWNGMSVETYEGGEKLDDLSEDRFGWQNTIGWNWTEARPAMLFIDSKVQSRDERTAALQAYAAAGADSSPTYTLPDVRQFLNLFPDSNNVRTFPGGPPASPTLPPSSVTISDTALLTMLGLHSRFKLFPPSELPQRWIELSQFDVVVISFDDLKSMARSQPKQFAAIRDWLSTGPALMVYGVGEKYASLQELESLL